MKTNMNSSQIIYASEVEEFFWVEDDISVPQGTPIGYEVERGNNIDLVLFEDIYWSDRNL